MPPYPEPLSSPARIFEQTAQGRDVLDGQRVYQIDAVPAGDLDQSHVWIEGPFTHEFGVQGDFVALGQPLDEAGQLFVGCYEFPGFVH